MGAVLVGPLAAGGAPRVGGRVRPRHLRGVAGGRPLRSLLRRRRVEHGRVRRALRRPATRARRAGRRRWGAHDPGLDRAASAPAGLLREMERRVGPYPGERWVYATPWASPDDTRQMGNDLVASVDARSRARAVAAHRALRRLGPRRGRRVGAALRGRGVVARDRPHASAARGAVGADCGRRARRGLPRHRPPRRRPDRGHRSVDGRGVLHGRDGSQPLRRRQHGVAPRAAVALVARGGAPRGTGRVVACAGAGTPRRRRRRRLVARLLPRRAARTGSPAAVAAVAPRRVAPGQRAGTTATRACRAPHRAPTGRVPPPRLATRGLVRRPLAGDARRSRFRRSTTAGSA